MNLINLNIFASREFICKVYIVWAVSDIGKALVIKWPKGVKPPTEKVTLQRLHSEVTV